MDINYKVMERCEYTDAAQPASGSAFISLFLFLLLCAAPLISSRANTPTETYTAGLEKIRRKNRCDTNGRKSEWLGISRSRSFDSPNERSHRPRFSILCLVSTIAAETKKSQLPTKSIQEVHNWRNVRRDSRPSDRHPAAETSFGRRRSRERGNPVYRSSNAISRHIVFTECHDTFGRVIAIFYIRYFGTLRTLGPPGIGKEIEFFGQQKFETQKPYNQISDLSIRT